MADKISLTRENIKYIRDAFSHFFPEDTVYSADKPYVSGEFNWDSRRAFIDFVYRLTGVQIKSEKDFQNIKKAELAVEDLVKTEGKQEANTQTKEQREQAEKIRQEREASQKKAAEDANTQVKAAAKKQQEIQTALQDKKIYAKVEIAKEVPPPDEATVNFINEAKAHPTSFQKDLAESIKTKITPALSKTLTEEEIGLLATKTAYDTVSAINNFPAQSSANTQTAILAALAKDAKVLPNLIPNKETAGLLQNSAAESSCFINNTRLSKTILSSINPNLATAVFGVGPENLKVEFFSQPVQGYTHEVDLGDLNQGHIKLGESQTNMLGAVGSFTQGEAKGFIMRQARTILDNQIAKLPADNAVAGFYNGKFGQEILNFAGLGKANPLGEGFVESFMQRIPGSSAFIQGYQKFFGTNIAVEAAPITEIAGTAIIGGTEMVEGAVILTEGTTVLAGEGVLLAGGATGIVAAEGLAMGVETEAVTKLLTPIAGKAAASALTKVATSVLGKSTVVALNTALQSLGSLVPIIGNAIALAVSWVATKIAKIIPWQKIKDNLIAISGGMLAAGLLIFPGTVFGTFLSVGGGLGLVGGVVNGGLSGLGSSLSGIGAGIGSFFGALGGTFLGAVGMPILVTILVFPVVVALILFIINAGAYIVPPSTALEGLQNPYIDIQKKPNPEGPFNNSDIPNKTKIEYTITVSAKQGPLTNITFKDECKVIKKGTPPSCPPPSQGTPTPPSSISPSSPFSFTYTVNITSHDYDDSAIVDTFTITADTPEAKGVTSASSASIVIGKPPMECPNNAWPLANDEGLYAVTQGSMTPLGWTHHNTPNAIDIGVNGATVIATHGGTATIGESACGGKWVEIASSCGSVSFYSYYGHLGATTVATGQKVTVGQTIAISDNTGSCSTGPHLHFQFFPTTNTIPATQKPYLKRDIPIGCTNQPGNLCN